ncbi:MAG: hypothetical protein HY739_13130 [Desulfobacterales bacterium]|nr:hypothetical protein [Desulfobacterales bacterium]
MAKLIIDVPDKLKYDLKLKATEKNQTMKTVIVNLIEEWLIKNDLQQLKSKKKKANR